MKTNHSELTLKRVRNARRLFELSLVSLLVGLAWTGCNPKQNSAIPGNPVGTYVLVSVDGNKVPCTVQHEGHAVPIQSGSFSINADGSCSSKILIAGQNSGIEVKATYTQDGAKLTMQWSGAGITTGTVKEDTFTMTNEGMIMAYQKEKKNSS